jgi:multidrug efflux pump subunit AcrA (membrane-fusion protein)
MKKKILFALIAAFVLLLPPAFAGCQSGISQADYDHVQSQLAAAQSQLAQAQGDLADLQSSGDALAAQLTDAQDEIADLESQVNALRAQYELAGDTPAETAANVVRFYHETHVYSAYDLFVCSDMASEVWNMLKAIGIDSLIAVGRIDTPAADILQSTHAWVLAEVAPGQYLALETTGGFTVPESQNPLYYQGWSFRSPADLKSYTDLTKEYNTTVEFRNMLADQANQAADLYNNSSGPTEADKWLALYDKLVELTDDEEAVLNDLMAQINSLATVISY